MTLLSTDIFSSLTEESALLSFPGTSRRGLVVVQKTEHLDTIEHLKDEGRKGCIFWGTCYLEGAVQGSGSRVQKEVYILSDGERETHL